MNDTAEFCYSTDEESFNGTFSTREEAFAEGATCRDPGEKVWTGVPVPYEPTFTDADSFLEQIAIRAEEELGEHAEGWLAHVSREESDELDAALTQVFLAWMEKHGHVPSFFRVVDVEEHTVPVSIDGAA